MMCYEDKDKKIDSILTFIVKTHKNIIFLFLYELSKNNGGNT